MMSDKGADPLWLLCSSARPPACTWAVSGSGGVLQEACMRSVQGMQQVGVQGMAEAKQRSPVVAGNLMRAGTGRRLGLPWDILELQRRMEA